MRTPRQSRTDPQTGTSDRLCGGIWHAPPEGLKSNTGLTESKVGLTRLHTSGHDSRATRLASSFHWQRPVNSNHAIALVSGFRATWVA
jgi:hypothetical protein